jgi:hypothetical protein
VGIQIDLTNKMRQWTNLFLDNPMYRGSIPGVNDLMSESPDSIGWPDVTPRDPIKHLWDEDLSVQHYEFKDPVRDDWGQKE